MTRSPLYPWTPWMIWTVGGPLFLIAAGFGIVALTDGNQLLFDAPHWWWLGAVGPVAGLAALYGVWQRRRAMTAFTSTELAPLLGNRVHPWRQAGRAGLFIAALLMVAAALIGPRWGIYLEKQKAYGVDVVVAMDVSRSMLARDVEPNRLAHAKRQIREQLVDRAVFRHSNRFGLIAFAGSTSMKLPLTSDYLAFRNKLEGIQIGSAPRGGTAIGQAIERATDLFGKSPAEATKIILVFTDGEDHEGDPVAAAKEGYDKYGIRTFTIGVGDEGRTVGAQVPSGDGAGAKPLIHDGQIVFSRLDVDALRRVAEAGSGRYASIAEFPRLVDAIGNLGRTHLSTEERIRHRPRFQSFLAAALLLLAAEMLIRDAGVGSAPRVRRVWQQEAAT